MDTERTTSRPSEVITTLPPLTTSSSEARTALEQTLRSLGCDDDMSERVIAVASELVANAVLHARTEAEVALRVRPRGVRIEVRDASNALPVLSEPDNDALEDRGRGLMMVRELSNEWGVDATGDGKIVWAEFHTPS